MVGRNFKIIKEQTSNIVSPTVKANRCGEVVIVVSIYACLVAIQLYPLYYCHSQREGMGLLEYQTMPSLREIAHNGWLCIFTK